MVVLYVRHSLKYSAVSACMGFICLYYLYPSAPVPLGLPAPLLSIKLTYILRFSSTAYLVCAVESTSRERCRRVRGCTPPGWTT